MAIKAEAVAIIIDVSPYMDEPQQDGKSALQKAITAANLIIQRKIFSDTKKNKDEAAIILFGTDGTDNNLNDQSGEGYEHITLARQLGVMDLELLKFVNHQIVAGNSDGDFIDALVVGLDHLHSKCQGRKMEQKIILFSEMKSSFDADQLDSIVNGMKANNVNLIFVGPEIDDDEDNDDNSNHPRNDGNDRSNKPLTDQQVKGVNCMRHILDETDGEGMSLSEVLPLLSFFESRRRKQVTTFRGPIEIGESLKINSYAYVKVSEEKPASWKKLSALAETAASRNTLKVEMQRSFYLNDEDQTEVDKEDTAQAFRYGKTLVPITSDEQKSLKLQTTKGCLVLGFTSRENVNRQLFSRNGCHIFSAQPDDEHAAVAFSALCHALEEKNMVAIVRYVSRANTDPKIGFLAPHIKSDYESLIFIALPYREDIRQYNFQPLSEEDSAERIQLVDALIENMGLVKTFMVDDEEEKEELFKPKNILNPITQRQCQCVQSRALDEDQVKIPDVDDYIARALKPDEEMARNAEVIFDKMKEKFPLEVIDTKKNKGAAAMFGPSTDEPPEKKNKVENVDETDNFSFSSLARNQITEVGIVDPINDFKILIDGVDSVKFEEIADELRQRILRLILDSFLDQYYQKAIDCLKAFREVCVERKIGNCFNLTLNEIKEETVGKRRNDFWELIAKEKILPLSLVVVTDSKLDNVECEKFYVKEETIKEEPESVENLPQDDEEDLLAMM